MGVCVCVQSQSCRDSWVFNIREIGTTEIRFSIHKVIKGPVCQSPLCTFCPLLHVCLIHEALGFQEVCTVDTDRGAQTIGLYLWL